jgi:hypothetical protein
VNIPDEKMHIGVFLFIFIIYLVLIFSKYFAYYPYIFIYSFLQFGIILINISHLSFTGCNKNVPRIFNFEYVTYCNDCGWQKL